MRFGRRSDDRELEATLLNSRPEPTPEITRAIAGHVSSPRRGGFIAGIGRVPFSVAGGLTAVVLIAVIALGGVLAPLDATTKAVDLQKLRALQPNIHFGPNTPAANQYGSRMTICIGGFVQLRLFGRAATVLIDKGLAVAGKCSSAVTPPKGSGRSWVCLDGYIELRLSPAQISSLVGASLVTAGRCPSGASTTV